MAVHFPLSASRFPLSAFRCYCLLDSIPESKRVQAPLAPGFYRSCASRRTMGSGRNRLRLPAWFRGEFYMPPQAAIKWRRQAPTSPAAAILHNYPGRSPQPVREAQPVPDRTLAAQGRQARWLPQPSRPKGRVNLREYSLVSYLHGAACGEAAIGPSRLRVSI